MYGISHIRSVSVGLDSQIWYLFIYITGYLNVRKISETIDFRTFVGPLVYSDQVVAKARVRRAKRIFFCSRWV